MIDGGEHRSRLYGVYPAIVRDVQDPDNQGRVAIELPWVDPEDGRRARAWARLATMMAGNERGTWFIPEVGDEVLLSFLAGDPRHPIVVGALWNGKDAPPETMDSANNRRSITSRAGHLLRFDDTDGAGKVEVQTSGGHSLTLDDGAKRITVEHSGGTTLTIDAKGDVNVTTTTNVNVKASGQLNITAAKVDITAPMVECSAVLKCQTLIATHVDGDSYKCGVPGNVW